MSEARFLILETSGRVGQVALAEGARLLELRRLDEARRHARDLAPAVKELLDVRGWRPRDLHAVFVSQGPGSYTGLRVGIMSAKALAYVTGCALLGIETLAAIARQAPAEAQAVDALGDAQQDKVYVQRFVRPSPGAALVAIAALRIEPFDRWLAQRDDVWASGPGLRGKESRLQGDRRLVACDLWEPRAETLLLLGHERHARRERDDPWTVEPLYLRPSSAEEKWGPAK